jgi:protein CsiD
MYTTDASPILKITIDEDQWNQFVHNTQDFNQIVLEKRPYTRFLLAPSLQAVLGKQHIELIIHTVKSSNLGCVMVNYPHQHEDFSLHLKLATAFSCLLGSAYFDELTTKYYAAVDLAPDTRGDSFLSEPYFDLRLHTDGTFYKKAVEWVVLAKTRQHQVEGGELSLHHINALENLPELLQNPLAFKDFLFEASASKKISDEVYQPIFFEKNGETTIRFSDQFCHPQTIEQALFLHQLSESLENSTTRRIEPFPVGQLVILNNASWLHGRLKIKPGLSFSRQLLRLRGRFALDKEPTQ